MPGAPLAEVSLYNLVLFVHVAAIVVAFGVTFAYPVMFRLARQGDPRSLPYLHRVQGWLGPRVITGGAVVALLAGIYLAVEGPYGFDEPFVGTGLLIIIVLLGLGGAYFARQEARLLEIVERDIAGSGDGAVTLSEEYAKGLRRLMTMNYVANLLVLVAVFVMVVKPGT